MNIRKIPVALITVAAIAALAQGCSSDEVRTPPQESRTSGYVFAANEQGNSISVINLRTGKVETTPIPVSPHNLQTSKDGQMLFAVGSAAGEGGEMATAMEGPGRLLGFDAAAVSRGPTFDMKVGKEPAHVIVDPQRIRAFVTNAGDNTYQ